MVLDDGVVRVRLANGFVALAIDSIRLRLLGIVEVEVVLMNS